MNTLYLNGRATGDVTVNRVTGSDNQPLIYARWGIANDRPYKNQQGEKITDFFNVEASGKAAEFAEKFVKKGARMHLTCHLKPDSYDKIVGGETIKINTIKLVVEDIDLIDWPEKAPETPVPAAQPQYQPQAPVPQAQAPVPQYQPQAPVPQAQAPVPQYQPQAPVPQAQTPVPQYQPQAPVPQYQPPVPQYQPQAQAQPQYAGMTNIPSELPFN